MTIQEALNYINFSVKEGYMSNEEAERLEALPEEKMVKEVEEIADRADAGANAQADALALEGMD